MNKSVLFCALGALALAGSGCAYQGSGYGYGHSSHKTYPTYKSHSTQYAPYRYGVQHIGSTRLEFEGGAEQFIDGNIITGGDTVGTLTTNDVAYSDAYSTGYRASAGLARDVRPNTTVMARGFYREAEADDPVVIGTDGGNVLGTFSDYKSYGAELGLRQYLGMNRPGGLRPYLGATLGAEYIEDIELISGGTGVLNEAGWVPTASGMAGVEMAVSPTASLALESGVRWTGSQDRSALASGLGFSDDDAKMSVPVTLRGSFRF